MTLRLSSLFEAQLKAMSASKRKAYKLRSPRKTMNTRATANGGPGTSRTAAIAAAAAAAVAAAASYNSNDSDDDSIQTARPAAARNGRQLRRNPATHSSNSNGVSSSMHAGAVNSEPVPGPSTSSGRGQRRVPRRSRSPSHDVDDLSDSPSSSSTSDGESDDDSSTAALPLSSLGVSSRQRKKIGGSNSDSEESYKPNRRNAHPRKNKKNQRKSQKKDKDPMKKSGGGSLRSATKATKRRNDKSDESDNDEDDDYDVNVDNHDDDVNDEDYNVHSTPKKRSPARPRRTKKHSNIDTSSAEDTKRKSGSKRRYESDHSYHMNSAPSSAHKRRIQLGTESESEQPRPTRSRVKKPPPTAKPTSHSTRSSWASQDTNNLDPDEPSASSSQVKHNNLLIFEILLNITSFFAVYT